MYEFSNCYEIWVITTRTKTPKVSKIVNDEFFYTEREAQDHLNSMENSQYYMVRKAYICFDEKEYGGVG